MKTVFVLFMLPVFCLSAFGQGEIKGRSASGYANIQKEPPKPPFLAIVPGSLQFTDPNGNNCIDANEHAVIAFELENSGMGAGEGLKTVVRETTGAKGITITAQDPGTLPVGAKKRVEITIGGNMQTTTGRADFSIFVDEPNGFGSDPVSIQVNTRAFVAPLVKITDHTVTSENSATLVRKRPFELQISLQNVAYGDAEEVQVALNLPENIVLLSGSERQSFAKLAPGEAKVLAYSLIVTDRYAPGALPLRFTVSERYGKYAESNTIDLTLNQALSSEKLVVQATEQGPAPPIAIVSLSAETDKNIPVSHEKNPNRYALVIGNEDYSRFQPGLTTESNVEFARNDAVVFARYCENLLGVSKENLFLITDATSSQMKQNIEKIAQIAKYSNGNAEIIFYYAGHGFPDAGTHESYLVPVDVTGSNAREGIRLGDLYRQLTSYPVQRVTVILDACFSGGGRNQGLLAARFVKIKPKSVEVTGNMVVFAATAGDQVSLPYRDKQHGMFTYYLLKKLQDSGGELTYEELALFLKQQVPLQSVRVNNKGQEPEVTVSNEIGGEWKTWRVK